MKKIRTEKIEEGKKIYDKYTLFFSVTLWLILNLCDFKNILNPSVGFKTSIIILSIHFFLIYILTYITLHVFRKRKESNYKHGIIIFSIYVIIMGILLLLVWPGTWSWDDIYVLIGAQDYYLVPWQHFLSSLFQIVCLKTFPFFAPSGIIIMQIIISGIIASYCIVKISSLISSNSKESIISKIILFVPIVLPPVVLYILSGYRMGIYSFIELFLIVRLMLIYKENKKVSILSLAILSLLVIIVASWRTEGIYYLILYFILLILLGRNKIPLKHIFVSVFICVISVFCINKVNNFLIGNNNYSITAIIEPLQALIKTADVNSDKEDLEKINKILDINMIYDNPSWSGSAYYWAGIVKSGYSKNEYSDLLKSYVNLTLKYPKTAITAMWQMFYETSGLKTEDKKSTQSRLTTKTKNIFDKSTEEGKLWEKYKSNYKYPISEKARNITINFLSGVNENDEVNFMYYIFWNIIIPIILAICCLIYELIKKNWFMVFLIITILLRIFIVFATSPSPYVMYYLSVYLISYFIFNTILLRIIFKRNQKNFI